MRTTAARTHSNSAPTKIPSDTTFLEEAGIFSYRRIGRRRDWGIQWPHSEDSIYSSIEWPTERLRVRTKCLLISSKEL